MPSEFALATVEPERLYASAMDGGAFGEWN